MARETEVENALRTSVNAIIGDFNQNYLDWAKPPNAATSTLIHDQLLHIWTTYFSDGRIEEATDKDLLDGMCRIPFSIWPEQIMPEVCTELTRIMGRPLISMVNTRRMKEESRYLLQYADDATSQSGEDGILKQIFQMIGANNKWCVEFGAWDGKNHSNTYTLITEDEWHGVLIEGRSDRFGMLEDTYRDNDRAFLINGYVGFEKTTNSLDYMLGLTAIPKDLDLLIVDIDGNDWHIWDSLEDYRPRIIVIEHNPTIPNDVLFIQERNQDVQQGCSLSALIMLGKLKGYELICTTNYNAIFVVKEEFPKFNIDDNSIDAMHVPIMDGRIFHCYDSSIHAIGMPKLVWDWNKHGSDWASNMPEWFTVYER